MSDTRELLEMRFKRYLHYGSELPTYKTGDRFFHQCYTKENIPSLIKLLTLEEPEKLINIILKVKNEGTSLWPDALIFALAYCATQSNPSVRQEAYKVIRQVCKTPREIILFVKFWRGLGDTKGGGHGFKKAIAQWYLVWMPFDLADILLQQKGFFGWSHTDILRLAHVKPVSIEQQVLLTYASKGLKAVEKKYGDNTNEQVVELVDYITTVENFRKMTDPEMAAKSLAVELHPIERVPSVLLKHQPVWNELIQNMDVKTLLDNLQRISILGFLKSNNITVMRVMDVLNNVRKAEEFKGHPVRVYIELQAYEKAAKYCLDIAAKLGHPISKMTPARKPPKINVLIKNALMNFFLSLHKFQKPTNQRYLVAVDVRSKMASDRCHGCIYTTPIEAASAMCLSLIRTEPDNHVTVAAFQETKGDLEVLKHLNKETEMSKFESIFSEKGASSGPASVAAAIHWAEANKKAVDVFIIFSNFQVNTSGTRPAIQQYRTKMNLPNAKVITCSLTGKIRAHKDVEGQNMMSVVGFDEHVPRAIEAFARGAF